MNSYNNDIIIALDAMGGDFAPSIVIEGAALALEKYDNLKFKIFGNQNIISPIINRFPKLLDSTELIHTEKFVKSTEKPSAAIRSGKGSSMWMMVDSVKSKTSHACISSGNTGALMAISKILLKTLPNISRPAIAGILPTIKGQVIMLDLGANAVCSSENLLQFAIMGEAFAKILLKKENPKVGLLNIGSEEEKGNEIVRLACSMISKLNNNFNWYGYIEGDDIAKAIVDVVVTDGFSGNIALKTTEGTAMICKEFMKQAFSKTIFSKIGYFFAKKSIKKVFNHIDHRKYNGAMFLGLNGIVVKSHGSTDKVGFANAIEVAISLSKSNINEKIDREINSSGHLVGLYDE